MAMPAASAAIRLDFLRDLNYWLGSVSAVMVRQRKPPGSKYPWRNQRRVRMSFAEALSSANRRAHDEANRRGGRRQLQSMRAVIDASELGVGDELEWFGRLGRGLLGLLLLPVCWVTMWTLLSQFSHATLEQAFWQSAPFWYFATGALLMIGWFASRLLQPFFLYLYVLGHELTHVVFVLIFRGTVTDFHVSTQGGYITTNKTNLVIALSPYFVPFWAVVGGLVYAMLKLSVTLTPRWDLAFYGIMGFTWTFHMVWTVWMIPRDQPDLRENGTLLSLVVIFQANLLVLVALLCVAGESPWHNLRDFATEWLRNAAIWCDTLWRSTVQAITEVRAFGKF